MPTERIIIGGVQVGYLCRSCTREMLRDYKIDIPVWLE